MAISMHSLVIDCSIRVSCKTGKQKVMNDMLKSVVTKRNILLQSLSISTVPNLKV